MISMTRRAVSASPLALLAGCATNQQTPAQGAPAARAAIGAFGVDLAGRDLNVKPGDDFFLHSCGTWVANTEIPADRPRWGTFDMLRDKSDRDVRTIIEEVAAAGGAPGSNQQKIADFYNSYLDQDALDARGLAPVQADIALVNAARTHEDILRLIGRPDLSSNSPIAWYANIDNVNPERWVVNITHAGLGLPDREYYLRDDGEFPNIRAQYAAHIERILTLGGQAEGARKARAISALEMRIARLHWPLADRRDAQRTYNPMSRAQLQGLAPRFPWDAGFEASGLSDVRDVVVNELSAIRPLADLFLATPVATWRDYLTYQLLSNNAAVLPRAIDEANFDFFGKTLNGQPQQRERWKRAVTAVNNALGEAIGQIYVDRHFPPNAKAQMLELVENMRRAYGERIDQSPWMSAETKLAAREKLATFLPKIGYPDKWRDYSALEIRAGDAYGNQKRVNVYQWNDAVAHLGRPSDRAEWFMTPQTVNAYYNPGYNEVVFPAAILQPPFFDPNADPAVNYGGIGGTIGHEMGHGFDDQGSKYDARGVLRDWWTAEDARRFNALGDRLVAQYDAFEPLPGIHVNGRQTLGENIGDNGGAQVAYRAYQMSLAGRTPEILEGLSGDQRFFLAFAQSWRIKYREQFLRNQLLSDVHSPPDIRCNASVRNMDSWYAAFNVQPGDALYLPPEERVTIW